MADSFLDTFQGADFTIMMNQAAQELSKSAPVLDPRLPRAWPNAAAAVSKVPEPSGSPPWRALRGSRSKPADALGAAVSFPAKPASLGHVDGATSKAASKGPATAAPNPKLPVAAPDLTQPAACPAKARPVRAAKAVVDPAKSPEAYVPIKRQLEEKDNEIAYLRTRLHNSQRGGRNKIYHQILHRDGPKAAAAYWNPPVAVNPSSSSGSKDGQASTK